MCISLWVNKSAYLSSSSVFSTVTEIKMGKSRLWKLSVTQQAKCESLNKGINFKHDIDSRTFAAHKKWLSVHGFIFIIVTCKKDDPEGVNSI